MKSRYLRTLLWASLVLALAPGESRAQYAVPNPYVNPYAVNPYGGVGGYAAGQAQVIQSTGQLLVDQEQARIERQKADQAKIDTQKKAFDEAMYEKALTPTHTENN